ncbi:MAG: hypothetical protein WCH11_04210, partial [Bdellovibrio sp.]
MRLESQEKDIDFAGSGFGFSNFKSTLASNPWTAILVVLVLSFSFHFPHFSNRELVLFDDQVLVTRMQDIKSFKDYLVLYTSGRVIDRQPLRDASYILDWNLTRSTGAWTFKWTQWLIWGVCLTLFSRILVLISTRPWPHFLYLFFVGLHPVTPIVSAWIGGRKHLLAVVFVLAATFFWLQIIKSKEGESKLVRLGSLAILCWAVGLMAQPIILFWPLWAYLVFPKPRRTALPLIIVSLALGALVGIWNWNYYHSNEFLNFFGQMKTIPESFQTFFFRFVVWGRSIIHILFPFFPNFWPWDLGD